MNFIKIFLSLLAISISNVDAYKFLVILQYQGRSHFIVASSLMKALAERGHEVTVASMFPQKKPLKNYNDIELYNGKKAADSVVSNVFDMYDHKLSSNMIPIFDFGYAVSKATLEEPNIQKLLRSNLTFDAVICEAFHSESLFGFSEHFKAPLIAFAPMGTTLIQSEMVGNPLPPSYVPHVFSSYSHHMTMWERLNNFAIYAFELAYMNLVYLPRQELLYKKHFPHANRSMYEVRKDTALMIINQHVTLSYPQAYMPNQIEIAGMHINRKRTPLPEDLHRFIVGAKHGVIYFSMGTNIKISGMPAEKLQAITETFRELKQRILWKSDLLKIPGKPENVYLSSWFPQDDILTHPNVKLFITHGGLLSTTETIYHAKPILGIPIFIDQFLNMKRAESIGYGITLDYGKLSKDNFKSAIEEILNNPIYTERVREVSGQYHDQPMEPLERAIFWVEHVVRQKGAKYMRSAGLDLSFIEYHSIDVMIILFGGVALFVGLVLITLAKVLKTFFQKWQNKKFGKKLKQK